MKNKYKLLNQDDDLENNLETSNQIELVNINSENIQTNQDICSICLEQNGNTSIELKCKCGNKFHSNCVKELQKHNIKKCPLCKKNISGENIVENINYIHGCFTTILFLFACVYMIIIIQTYIINPFNYIFAPSELKYCDNLYNKCEYYPVKAFLFNNTINEQFNNFDIKYELVSSYKYIDYDTKQNKTCINLESHEFVTYIEVLKVSKKSIGIEKNIYVPFDNNKKQCKLSYKFYNPVKFILNVITLLNFIWIIPMVISFTMIITFVELDENIQNVNKYIKGLIIILHFIVMTIHFILQFIYAYYYFF
jgi:hypothetical protein